MSTINTEKPNQTILTEQPTFYAKKILEGKEKEK